MSEYQDVEVTIRPTLRSRNGGLSFEVRKVVDSVTGTGWTLTDLTPLNLRKIADAIYASLGKTVEDLENEAYMRGLASGRQWHTGRYSRASAPREDDEDITLRSE